jgi:hypothetical protein
MGKQVVYCDGCGRILLEEDFAKARATLSDNRSFCIACRPASAEGGSASAVKPKTDRTAAAAPAPPGAKRPSSSRIQRPSSSEMRRPPLEPPPTRSRTPLLVGGALGGLGVVVLIAGVALSGKKERPHERAAEAPQVEARRSGPSTPAPPPPSSAAAEEADTAAFRKAVEYRRLHPTDLVGQLRRFEDAAQAAGGRPVGEEARREAAAIRRRFSEERDAVEAEAAPLLASEEFRRAAEVWERAGRRYDEPEWARHAAGRAVAIRDQAAGRFPELRARAVEARRRGAAEEVRQALERVARWGLPEFRAELEKVLAATEEANPAKAASVAAAPAKTAAGDAWGTRWKAAVFQAASRDFAGAVQRLLEPAPPASAAADVDALRGAAAMAAEAGLLMAKGVKGQKVKLACFDASGARVSVEGTVAAADACRFEARQGPDLWVVPWGEVTAAAAADVFRARLGRKPEDARAAALLCVLEGDLEGARRHWPELSPEYEALAKDVLEALSADAAPEAEARRRFYRAEMHWFDPSTQFDAVQAYRGLLAEFGETRFVRRNRAAIESRTEAPREFVLGAAELDGRGSFRLGRHNKMESCWISDRDVEEAALKANFVDVRFPAVADVEYRAWVYVGACCLETFAFFVQGTELSGPDAKNPKETVRAEPGGDAWVPVKLPYLSLKKLHEMHTGPKEPDRWEWIAVPLPKYGAAGTKTLRLLSRQKGFSVAHAVVSARRTGPPRDAELRDAERDRAESPGYGVWKAVGFPTGAILREVWTDVAGTSIADLRNAPGFPDKPSATHLAPAFETPVNWADDYGTLLRGYLYPPATGEYVFWVSGDDQCELWLSTDDQPKNKVRIAFVPEWSDPNQWTKFPEQQSAPVVLKAGRRYYIEALQKEGGGGDSLSVGWKGPDGTDERPIPGARLAPFRR